MQYGLNLAVLKQAKDGSCGRIAVWNATSLASLEMTVNLAKARPGQTLMYQLEVRNLSPAPQAVTVSDPIPANTTYKSGGYFNTATNCTEWTGTIAAYETRAIVFSVKVNAGTPAGTVITNNATLTDDASWSNASATTVVK